VRYSSAVRSTQALVLPVRTSFSFLDFSSARSDSKSRSSGVAFQALKKGGGILTSVGVFPSETLGLLSDQQPAVWPPPPLQLGNLTAPSQILSRLLDARPLLCDCSPEHTSTFSSGFPSCRLDIGRVVAAAETSTSYAVLPYCKLV
jgi:hypothetical protein